MQTVLTFSELARVLEAQGFFLGQIACQNPKTTGIVVVDRAPDGTSFPKAVRVQGFLSRLIQGDTYENVVVKKLGSDGIDWGNEIGREVPVTEVNALLAAI